MRLAGVALGLYGMTAGCGCPGKAYHPAPELRPLSSAPLEPTRAPAAAPRSSASAPVLPMFRGDAGRSGRTASSIPALAPSLRWRLPTGRAVFSSPAIDGDGNIYVGSLDGSLYSARPDGTLRWKHALGGRIYASPALTGSAVVVGSDADRFFLVDGASGEPRWSLPLGPCAGSTGVGPGPESVRCDADSSPAVAPDGTIYLGGDALYALRPDGSLRWRALLAGHAFSSPALDPAGNVYIGSQGAFASFDGAGKKRWEQRGLYDFDSTPTLTTAGLVVVGADDGRLYAFGTSDGRQAWVRATRGPVLSSAAVTPDGGIVFGSDDGKLRSLGPDGSQRWTFAAKGPIRSSPLVDRAGRVLFGAQDDQLYALDPKGQLLWSLPLPGDLDSSPALCPDGTILVGCDDGHLYAVR